MKSVLEYLEQSAERYPDKIAAADETSVCTYGELLNQARKIGSFLVPRIENRDSVVCFMEKSNACLQAFLGIVYAGGFYTLLDPDFPQERIKQIMSVLTPKVIITTHKYDQQLQKLGSETAVIYLESIPAEICAEGLAERRKNMSDRDPLYCNFTSGSTGVPKGVLVCHQSVIDFIDVFTETFHLSHEDVFGNQAPFDFDVSVKDIYSSLKVGGTLVIIPKAYFMTPAKIVEMLEEYHVTTLIWAVSALCMLMRLHALKHLRPSNIQKIMFSGEVMPIKQLNQWMAFYPDAMFVNLYGPTEITCNCTYHILDRAYTDNEKIPIGIPFKNERVFLLDEQDRLVKDDKVGEICVAGTALALGYYRNSEMTAKHFVQNPLQKDYPEMVYRTGDLASYQDGVLMFMGRKDFQIKHMGHRIELEEIEAALNGMQEITHCCCMYDTGKNKIVAFYCGSVDKTTVFRNMKEIVPEYMVPNIFNQLAEIPLTKNGKTDRKLLFEQYQKGTLRYASMA